MSKRGDHVMKCGRCGQWIPLNAWKYAVRRVIHDDCPASPKVEEAPAAHILVRRRGRVLREIR
jgi:hypothetical protein